KSSALDEAARLPEGELPSGAPPLPADDEVLSAEDIVEEIIEADADDLVVSADAADIVAEDAADAGDLDEDELVSLEAEEADDLIVAETDSVGDEDEIDRSLLPEL